MDELVNVLTQISSSLEFIGIMLAILVLIIMFKKTSNDDYNDDYWIQRINDRLRDIHDAIKNYKSK